MMPIGSKENGLFHPIINALGSKQINGIRIPFRTGCIAKLDVDNIKPDTTHKKKAERLASQVNPWSSIGITSSVPATIPSNIPTTILFFMLYPLYVTIMVTTQVSFRTE